MMDRWRAVGEDKLKATSWAADYTNISFWILNILNKSMKLQLYVIVYMSKRRFSQEIGGNTLLGISLGEDDY